MSSISSTQESKILDILQHLESINLSLKEVVDYKNQQKSKNFGFNPNSKRSWASDDEEDDDELFLCKDDGSNINEDFINNYNKVTSNIQDFITEVIKSDDEIVLLLMSSWGNIKINKDTSNDNDDTTNDDNLLSNSTWGGKRNDDGFIVKTTKKHKQKLPLTKNVKQHSKSKHYKLTDEIINNRINVYTLDDFRDCISSEKKMKGCIRGWNCTNKFCKKFYHIQPEAHCHHTYDGTLCENVLNCHHIHIQRCLNEIEHYNNGNLIKAKECPNKKKSCSFLHQSDLPDDESKENFDNTMNEYKKKKSKQFFNH